VYGRIVLPNIVDRRPDLLPLEFRTRCDSQMRETELVNRRCGSPDSSSPLEMLAPMKAIRVVSLAIRHCTYVRTRHTESVLQAKGSATAVMEPIGHRRSISNLQKNCEGPLGPGIGAEFRMIGEVAKKRRHRQRRSLLQGRRTRNDRVSK